MQLTGRLPPMRLELTMFMLSLSSTISRVCLTVQKPTVRTYRIEKTLPQTFYTTFAGSSHALHHTDITRVGTPCSFFVQPLSPTYSCTPFAFELITQYLVLCGVYQVTPSYISTFHHVAVCGPANTSLQLALSAAFQKYIDA
jgi:hypothetical protein